MRYTAGRCPWLPAQPCVSSCGTSSLLVGALAGLAAGSQLAAALSTSVSGQQGAYLWRTPRGVEETPGQGSTSRSAGTKTIQACCWPCPSVPQSSYLPSLQPRGMSQLRKPARDRAPGWEQRAGGGSWRPCDRWRLSVSQGELGRWLIPALNLRRPHMTPLWEPACQGQEERWEGGGSDFRIHAGNTKYTCESQADIHHMTPLALPMQKSGLGHRDVSHPVPCAGCGCGEGHQDGSGRRGASHASGLPLPECLKTRTQNQLPVPAPSICSLICSSHNSPISQ